MYRALCDFIFNGQNYKAGMVFVDKAADAMKLSAMCAARILIKIETPIKKGTKS